ncbi:IS6 family transposase [Haloparvum sp. PAK95]|uniref:IS6 family transposase n=1 Tax=Haloparvum sp. PAK95 TaxID=3418962 RepID=UPI003D2F2A2B
MPETARLTESTDWIDLEFVERERTPREIIEKGIRYHLAGLSLSNTVTLLEDFGVKRSRTAVHNWVQKADLQPAEKVSPDHVALDQKMIQVNNDRYWLYAAVNPLTNRILHIRLFQTYSIYLTQQFLRELAEKHDVSDAVFLIDDARELESGLRNEGFEYRIEIDGLRNQIERVFREVERRTSSFSNCFSHVDPPTAETWLQAFAVWWNHA